MKTVAIVLFILSCAAWLLACCDEENQKPPICADVGCEDTNALLCKSRELCVCPQKDAEPIECRP